MQPKKFSELTVVTETDGEEILPIIKDGDGDTILNVAVKIKDLATSTTTQTQIDDAIADLDAHIADVANPHQVTKSQVGLSNVDNTSDATKNTATATLTNKTLTDPTIGNFSNSNHTHADSNGGGQLTATTALNATGSPDNTRFLRGDNTWSVPAGLGDVTSNTATSVVDEVALFSDTSGKVIKRATGTGLAVLTSGVISTVAAPSGTVVGTSDSQTLTNKTLDNTNTITLKDTNFTIQDDGDTTKQAKFQASGISTATTRTLAIPNADTTIVGTDATQTLTNKTISFGSNTVSGTTAQFNTALSDNDFATLAGVETLTNKTLTSPKIGTSILDTNGNIMFSMAPQASAVNYIAAVNGPTGTGPSLQMGGSDTNVGFGLYSKGTGNIGFLSNTNGLVLNLTPLASAVNYLQIANGATGSSPYIQSIGADTNISFNVYSKGTGQVVLRSAQNGIILSGTPNASGVNYINVTNNVTGSPPVISATGADTNIDLYLQSRGTGQVMVNAVPVVTTTGTQTLTNKTLTNPKIGTIMDTNGLASVVFGATASAVNYVRINNAVTGGNPGFLSTGSDANIGIILQPKGSGYIQIYSSAGETAEIRATGADANHSLKLTSKGTGTIQANGVEVVTVSGTQTLTNKTLGTTTMSDAANIVINTTTGTKFGTAASQKIGHWNATPVVQPTTAGAAATFVANTSLIANDTATFDGYTIGQVVKALRTIGILA